LELTIFFLCTAKQNQLKLKCYEDEKDIDIYAAMLGGIMATSLTSCGEDAVEDVLNDRLGRLLGEGRVYRI